MNRFLDYIHSLSLALNLTIQRPMKHYHQRNSFLLGSLIVSFKIEFFEIVKDIFLDSHCNFRILVEERNDMKKNDNYGII